MELDAVVREWLAKADAVDDEEDRELGDKRGDELPEWVADKAKRLEKLRAAKAELEAEAKAALAAGVKPDTDPDPDPNKPRRHQRKKPKANGEPNDKAQLNFTDKDSKILKGPSGFLQGSNCQAAVDGDAQIIVAHATTNEQGDTPQLIPIRPARPRQGAPRVGARLHCTQPDEALPARRVRPARRAAGSLEAALPPQPPFHFDSELDALGALARVQSRSCVLTESGS